MFTCLKPKAPKGHPISPLTVPHLPPSVGSLTPSQPHLTPSLLPSPSPHTLTPTLTLTSHPHSYPHPHLTPSHSHLPPPSRYIAAAKTHHPVVPESLTEFLVSMYVDLRREARSNRGGANQTFTSARTLLALLRLSTALVRGRGGGGVDSKRKRERGGDRDGLVARGRGGGDRDGLTPREMGQGRVVDGMRGQVGRSGTLLVGHYLHCPCSPGSGWLTWWSARTWRRQCV